MHSQIRFRLKSKVTAINLGLNSRNVLYFLWASICLILFLRLEVLSLKNIDSNPYLEISDKVKKTTYAGTLFRMPLAPKALTLSADDCLTRLTVDNRLIHADPTCSSCKDCAKKIYPFESASLKPHSFEAEIQNLGGRGGLYNTDSRPNIPFALATIFVFGIFIIRKIKDHFITLPTLALFAVVFIYFKDTDLLTRQHDLLGHIEYLRLLKENLKIPEVNSGWETFHPPFYYLTLIPFSESVLVMQYLAFLTITSTMTLWAFFVSKLKPHFINSILVLSFLGVPNFWFLSARINNDVLLPLLSVLLMALWSKTHVENPHSKKYAFFLGITLAILLFTKVSTVSLFGAAGLCSLMMLRRHPKLESLKVLLLGYLPGVIVMIAHLYRTYSQTHQWVYQPNMNSALRVGNHPSVFFSFDLFEYFTAASAHPFLPGVRDRFWEYLLISSVSGEFIDVWTSQLLTVSLRALALLAAFAIVRGAYLAIKKPTPLGTYALFSSVFSMLFLIYFRMYGSNGLAASCSGDARFLVLAYPSFAILIAISLKAGALRSSLQKLQSSERI